nr:MAG TPA: hypothetical protein [Caudoviricetes sp.]
MYFNLGIRTQGFGQFRLYLLFAALRFLQKFSLIASPSKICRRQILRRPSDALTNEKNLRRNTEIFCIIF